jgi:hypothetical protein
LANAERDEAVIVDAVVSARISLDSPRDERIDTAIISRAGSSAGRTKPEVTHMPDLGLGGWIVSIIAIFVTVLVPALVIALGLRLAGVGRPNPQNRLRDRLARGEISQAEFDTAIAAFGR